MNENEDKMYQNLQNTANAELRENFIAINAYVDKQKRSQINNLTLQLKKLNSTQSYQKKGNHKDQSRDKENKKQEYNRERNLSLKRSTKLTNIQLHRLRKKREDSNYINQTQNRTLLLILQKYKRLTTNWMPFDEMDNFLQMQNLLNHEEIYKQKLKI